MEFQVYENGEEDGSGAVMERLYSETYTTYREALAGLAANTRYSGIDLWLDDRWHYDVQDRSRLVWYHITDKANPPPEDGTYFWSMGRAHDDPNEVNKYFVVCRYASGGFTEGWEDERRRWFVPIQWAEMEKQ